MDFTTDLIPTLPDGASVLPTIFDLSPRGLADNLEGALVKIEKDALAETFDMDNGASRKACGSLAYKVSRSKSAIAEIGDAKAAELRAGWDAINVHRRTANSRLDALRDKVKAPLDEWKRAETERVEAHEDALTTLRAVCDLTAALGSAIIREHLKAAQAVEIGDRWEEFEDDAREAWDLALAHLDEILVTAEKAEAAEAELVELRRERDERAERDQKDTEERQIRIREQAAADQAKGEAEAKAERAIEAEKDRAEREVRAIELRAQKAEADARDAVERERSDVAVREKAEADAKAKREADTAHRERIICKVTEALEGFTDIRVAAAIAEAIADGKIPHVHITY